MSQIEEIKKRLAEHSDKNPSEVLTNEEFVFYRDFLLSAWEKSKADLEIAKTTEMDLRKAVVDFAFDRSKNKGTENIDLGNGWKAKAVKKINFGWVKTSDDKTDKEAIEKALLEIEKDGPAAELIADRLITWTPALSQTEYKLLPEKYKAIIDKVIVTSDGAPTLEIIPPKA